MATESDTPGETSIAAQHAARPTSFYVAPTEGSTAFNVIRIPLVPIACWRLGDPAFDFDSSFVLPTFRGELATLSGIVQANPGCPAAIFAHADPSGSDELNKTISDRRAIAIYALLTRQPAMWEDLYSQTQAGDRWGTRAIQTMLQAIPGRATDDDGNALPADSPYYAGALDAKDGPATKGAIKQFQTDSGLGADGVAGADTRKVLFGAYMDWLCSPPGASAGAATPFRMGITDFLGGEGAAEGDLPKISLQGCSRFNPVVLLTNDEMNGDDTHTRNADDAPNRRVVLFFFPSGTTGDAGKWPCPKVKEAQDACKNVFWSDGDTRRLNGDAKREYKVKPDTMACRFYDRFARRSPCETNAPRTRSFSWVTLQAPSTDSIDLVVQDGDTDVARSPMPMQCTGPGDCTSFSLDDVPFGRMLDIELSFGKTRRLPPTRVQPGRLRSALTSGDADLFKQAFEVKVKEGDALQPLAEGTPPDPDTNPPVPLAGSS